ncbi:MarR family transcriptional regulator [Saliphagus infecundisoli]|uniref:HTH marR-type domain-containing protein n=1 Tax=Saliphagus infecundisoli TaxID=1849069 RepID=A0ABD5QJ20_9EURY|nr:helix-turn-helix domain-containing protein [Saliphagus infecundisoli]
MLEPEQLNTADNAVLNVLQEGRVTPGYVEDRTDYNQSYVSQRLRRLEEHGHVKTLATGLWELIEDPRTDNVKSAEPQSSVELACRDLERALETEEWDAVEDAAKNLGCGLIE